MGTASVKRKEIINDTRTPLVVERKVTYGSISEFELREKFFALQKTGYIINESFSDDEWIVRNELKDAALLTLNICKKSLEHGMILKDASSYNVQFYKPI